MSILKDQRLAELSAEYNVARFASFDPDCNLRYSIGIGDQSQTDLEAAIASLFRTARTVNVRTFLDDESKSTDFIYGLERPIDAAATVRKYADQGLFTIVNETIDISDGGVSGVSMAQVTEFAPGGTPRLVEDPNRRVAQLQTSMAWAILRLVYRIDGEVGFEDGDRVEFSVHPSPVGHRNEKVLVWEAAPANEAYLQARPTWPNDFSQHIGDKTFGLLVAHTLGFRVPASTVIPRRLPPFAFGTSTASGEIWIRTAPATAEPGYFTTSRGWLDPFSLLADEDPEKKVSAVISQEGVSATYSGGALSRGRDSAVIEGVAHSGLDFMSGAEIVGDLPARIVSDVNDVIGRAQEVLGGVQLEWVHDGTNVWVVQLHAKEVARLESRRLSSGNAEQWLSFDPSDGLDRLRVVVKMAVDRNMGVEVLKPVGVTSHVGDILRKARVPGRFAS